MPTSNRNRRLTARPVVRPSDDIMQINTGDVIPLFDDELDILDDDRPAPVPVMAPASELRLRKVGAVAPRRPQKEAAPKVEMMETMVTTSLAERENAVSDAGFSEAFLYVEKGPGAGQLVPVLQGDLVMGRSSENRLQLNHPSVSRKHAVLSRKGEQYFLVDAGSQNGTYVNWAKIRGEVEVFPGDQISVGSAVVVVRGGVYTSAMRRGGTGLSEVPAANSTKKWIIGTGVFGAAVGIGVAAVVMLSGRQAVKPAAPVVAAKTEAKSPAETKPVEAKAEAAKTEIAKTEPVKAAPEVAEPEPKAEPKVAVREQQLSRHTRKHERASRHERTSRKAEVAAAAPASTEAPPAVLKIYETGNIESAIAAAEGAGASKLASKMAQFKSVYAKAKSALAAKDGAGAVSGFNKALKLDESIDSGWGKLNGEIRGELASLYVLAGNQAQARGDDATALKAYKAAQGYQPANAQARAKIKSLQSAAKGTAPAGNARAAADAAFDS